MKQVIPNVKRSSPSDPAQEDLVRISPPLILCAGCNRRIVEHSEDEYVACWKKHSIEVHAAHGPEQEAQIREGFPEFLKLLDKRNDGADH